MVGAEGLVALVCVWLAAALPVSSCALFESSKGEDATALSDADLSNQADDRGGNEAEPDGKATSAAAQPEPGDTLPHPRQATAWHTRVLIDTTPQPKPENLRTCAEQLRTLALKSGNAQDLSTYETEVANMVHTDLNLYHFCFYQLMVRLDERLDVGGEMMTTMANTFFLSMKELWLLARGLDRAFGRDRYFAYLRHRYLQLSQTHFGRSLEVLGPPLGSFTGALPIPAPAPAPAAKPAGPAPTKP